nr:MAG TPA: hypothetical protein [Caudoviricetes sp.]
MHSVELLQTSYDTIVPHKNSPYNIPVFSLFSPFLYFVNTYSIANQFLC